MQAITWFLDKKLVMTSFRKVETGGTLCLVEDPGLKDKPKTQANDMITFR